MHTPDKFLHTCPITLGRWLMYLIVPMAIGCRHGEIPIDQQVVQLLNGQQGDFAVAFHDLKTDEQLLVREHEVFHAASTMKTPVLIEIYKQVEGGKIRLSDSILVKNSFRSIVDSSTYSLDSADDSQKDLYKQIGARLPLSTLVYEMIVSSSNLATNIVIELVGARSVTQTMRDLGAPDIQVRRGVEDTKAFEQGLNNTTTAFDLMVMFVKIARGEAVGPEASKQMIATLEDQHFNSIIPAKLPKQVRVAHKTGSITGVHHDSGIVTLPDGHQYVLVLLSKNLKDEAAAIEAMSDVSLLLYNHVVDQD